MHVYRLQALSRHYTVTSQRFKWHSESLRAVEQGLLAPPSKKDARRGYRRAVICMAKPSKKGPETTVKIFCSNCKQFLYKYRKGGKGGLQKCFVERISEDETGGKLECPNCGVQFARSAMIRGRPANKIVGGKVFFQK